MRIRPVRDLALVEPLPADDVSPGGILLPDKREGEQTAKGIVREVGPGLIGTPIEPGVRIAYRPAGACPLQGSDAILHLVPYDQILAVIEIG